MQLITHTHTHTQTRSVIAVAQQVGLHALPCEWDTHTAVWMLCDHTAHTADTAVWMLCDHEAAWDTHSSVDADHTAHTADTAVWMLCDHEAAAQALPKHLFYAHWEINVQERV